MKKRILLTLTLCCCSFVLWSHPVGLSRALDMARPFTTSGKSPKLIKSNLRQRTTTDSELYSPYYIFSRGDNAGFVIVSGDDCLPSILGVTDSGDYQEGNMPPQFTALLDHYTAMIEYAQAHNQPACAPRKLRSDWKPVAPLLNDHWNQGSPFNNLCPTLKDGSGRAPTGCVATSSSEVLYFFHRDCPDTLVADIPSYEGDKAQATTAFAKGTPLKWDIMPMSFTSGVSYPLDYTNAVASLMACVGGATHLIYDSTTGGYINDVVSTYANYFNLSSRFAMNIYYEDSIWDEMIYRNLESGRPMVYGGSSDSRGGHAFVLDGYSNGRYHFNFGWGGQADGYYALTGSNAVNGFTNWQQMVFDITPMKRRLKAHFVEPLAATFGVESCVKVHVANNGSLPYKGFCFLTSDTQQMPFASDSCLTDQETLIPAGGEGDVCFSWRPQSHRDYTLYLTDSTRDLLDSVLVKVNDAASTLQLTAFDVNSTAPAICLNGRQCRTLYNDKARYTATVSNESDVPFEGTLTLHLTADKSVTSSFQALDTLLKQSLALSPHESRDILFYAHGIKSGLYYTACLQNSVQCYQGTATLATAADTILYLKAQAPDLACDSYQEGCAVISGNWNDEAFATLMKGYQEATSVDLTAVAGVDCLPAMPNPNCLFYIGPNDRVAGCNIIKEGVCDSLVLHRGHDFTPKGDFTARTATFVPETPCNVWETLYLPFDATLPNGCIAKQLTQATATKLTFEQVHELKAGTPYFYFCSSPSHHNITATHVTVTLNGSNQASPLFMGTYKAMASADTLLRLTTGSTPYFETTADSLVPAFNGYMAIEGATRVRPVNLTSDSRYQMLGQEIATARDLLDENLPYVTEEGLATYQDAIQNAEEVLAAQVLTQTTKIAAQIKLLQTAEKAFLLSLTGTLDHPADYTGYLANPSFEEKSTTGWQVSNARTAAAKAVGSYTYAMLGSDADYLFFAGGKENESSEAVISQTLTGLPAGSYLVKATLGGREGSLFTLFANEAATPVAAHRFGQYYGVESEVMVYLPQDSSLTLGARSDTLFKADNFRLYYLGADNVVPDDVKSISIDESHSTSPLQVMGGTGKIVINATTPSTIALYLPDGRLVRTTLLRAGSNAIEGLKRGIYMLKHHKVVVK